MIRGWSVFFPPDSGTSLTSTPSHFYFYSTVPAEAVQTDHLDLTEIMLVAASCHVEVCQRWMDSPGALQDILLLLLSSPLHADTAPAGSALFPSPGRSRHLAESTVMRPRRDTLRRTCRHLDFFVHQPVCQQQFATFDFLQMGSICLKVGTLHVHRLAHLLMGEPVELLAC